MAMRRILLPLLLVLTAAGCGLSPQTVVLEPTPQVEPRNIGRNIPVRVSGVDQRGQEAFGTRGGVYRETSLIRPANDVGPALAEPVRKGLQALGFNALNPGADPVRLEIQLRELSYAPEPGSVVNRVEIKAHVVARALDREGNEYEGHYRAGNFYEQPFTPTVKQNADRLNDTLTRAVEKLLQDPQLLGFLAGR